MRLQGIDEWAGKHRSLLAYLGWAYAMTLTLIILIPLLTPSIRELAIVSFFFAPLCLGLLALNVGLMLFMKPWRLPVAILSTIAGLLLVRPWLHDLASNGTAPAAPAGRLKVATFNWKVTNGAKFDYFQAWVGAESPDIVVIQEVPGNLLQNYKRLAERYPYRTFSNTREDVVVISRFPIIHYDLVRMDRRPIVHAVIATPWGRTHFFGLHAQTVRDDTLWALRSAYFDRADQILTQVQGNVIVAGDFNATVWDPAYQSLLSAGRLHAEPRLFPFVTRILATPEGSKVGSPIDHVVVSQGLTISGCHTGPSMGSDHVPLTCEIQSGASR